MPLVDLGQAPKKELIDLGPALIDLGLAPQIEPQGAPVAAPGEIPTQTTPPGPFDPSEPPRQMPFQQTTISAMPEKGKMAKILSWFQPFPRPISVREAPIEKLGRILSPVQNVIEKAVTGSQVPKLLWYGLSKVRPDLADKPWQETLDELSPYEQKGVSKAVGEVAEFISEIKTAGKLLKAVGWKTPAGKRLIDRIARNAPVWMTSGAINELVNGVVREKDAPEIAKEVAKQTLIRGGESIVWSGVEFGAGKAFSWALKKFPRFRIGWQKWAKGKKPAETRPARKEVDEALRIYKETGDRTQWDAVRIKYAGITPEGVERIKRRGIPSTEVKVKDFGQYPIVKAPAAPPVRPAVAPVAARPTKAPIPPKAAGAIVEPPAKMAVAKEPVEGAPLRGPVTVSGKQYHPVQLPTEAIGVDAEKFQFKLGAKLVGGVTEAMKGVEKWDPIKGGNILVWQDKAGRHWVVDGHHRVALAKKTNQPTMDTWVVREVDGWTAAEARAIGAMRNLADGKGTAVDAAKLFRDTKLDLDQLRKEGVPTNNTVIEQGMAMKDLSDEVFKLVVNERLPANYAAVIGRNVKDPTQQKQVADLILQGEVDSVRQAELLAITIDNAPVLTKSEMTLFGLETTEKSLYAERAKILANVEKKLKTNQKVFGTLSKQVGLIEAKGNILAKEENIRAKERADEVLYLLEKFATLKGPVAEALNDATKEYAKNPTKENLAKITNDLISRWTQATTGLSVQNIEGLFGLLPKGPEKPAVKPAEKPSPKLRKPTPSEIAEYKKLKDGFFSYKFGVDSPQMKRLAELEYIVEQKERPKGAPGFIDVTPLAQSHKVFMDIMEPAKAVEIKLGKVPYATVIRGIHKPEVARIEFNEQQIENLDDNLEKFAEKLSKYPKRVLDNLMLTRGKPKDKAAISIQNDALKDLAKNNPELVGTRKMIQKIADSNYTYLQEVVGDDIKYMEDYFYGIYKSTPKAKIDGFIDYWKTTKRFTKEKKLPTYADAKAYGLEIRDPNPVNNLMSEYIAIARLDGMIWMRDELLRTGKGEYIWPKNEAPPHSNKVPEPVFKDVRMDPDLAALIKKLISTNKVYRHWGLNTLRKINNAYRTAKFIFSAFHNLNIAKQSIADNGYLAYFQKSSTRGITTGFRKSDPIFKTKMYKDYIEHGGGHRYSIESEAQRAFTNFIEKLDKKLGFAFKAGALPIRIPKTYVKWLFQSYIPKVKYAKYTDAVAKMEEKLDRQLTSAEKIDIIKEQQNFYGMMNERLFGRSGTATTTLRFFFMAPGYGEGNYRTILKAALQWGGKEGWRANRSRSNIVNALLLTATAASIGTLIMTGKPPKLPEKAEDIRDLFKIDTGRVDDKGRRIMIDMLTFDKDYWEIYGNLLTGQFEKALKAPWTRLKNMKAGTFDMAVDLLNIAQGKAIYDWKGDKVVEVTDPFAQQVLQFMIHEIKKTEPISVSVFRRGKARKQSTALSALTALLGYRPTLTERDKRQQEELQRMYALKGRQEELYNYLASLRNPRASVEKYNQTVRNILDNVSPKIAAEWRKKLIIDTQRYLENKVYYLSQKNRTPKEIERAKHILKGFGVTKDELQLYLQRYWQRERKKPVRTVESLPIIGRNIKRKRAAERYK